MTYSKWVVEQNPFGEAVVQWSAFGHDNLESGFDSLISVSHFSIFGITAEWPKIIQIAFFFFCNIKRVLAKGKIN